VPRGSRIRPPQIGAAPTAAATAVSKFDSVLNNEGVIAVAEVDAEWRLRGIGNALGSRGARSPLETPERRATVRSDLEDHERAQLLAGGLLKWLRERAR
jgi:hypothetical protein